MMAADNKIKPEANQKIVKEQTDNSAKDALDIIAATTYGISPSFLRENEKLLDDTRKILSDRLAPEKQGKDAIGRNSDSTNVVEYVRALALTMGNEDRMRALRAINENKKYTGGSGIHSILDDSQIIDKLSDTSVVDELVSGVQNHFAIMPEYNKVCQLIPELDKCIDIIVKDIVNRDEFSHTFINNFYTDKSTSTEDKKLIEDKIKGLLKEYNFEDKIRKWLRDSEVCGVKPFSIMPQDDVIKLINQEVKRRNGKSLEDISVDNIFSVESYLIKSPLEPIYDKYDDYKSISRSTESDEDKRYIKSIEDSIGSFTKSIITTEMVDEWVDICKEGLLTSYKSEKINHVNSEEGYDKFCSSVESFISSVDDVKYTKESRDAIRSNISDLITMIDRSIEVVDPMKTPIYQASKKMKDSRFYNSTVDIDNGIVDDFYRLNDSKNNSSDTNTSRKIFTIDGMDIDVTEDVINAKDFNNNVKNKRAILTEYEPEHVIPVSSGGTHIGYYVAEYVRTMGDNFLALKKDKGSFADIVRRLGVGEDKSLMTNSGTSAVDSNNPFSSGVFSPSTIMAPILSGSGNGPMTPSGGSFGNNGQSDRRVELIKTIMIKTIAKRLGDETLVDDGTFQSSLMNVMRDDLLFKNKVRFTFIPESHMIYMSRELDSDGMPKSILDGSLFNCYIYISSLISSLMMKIMKSSDIEVMEVNVGKSKELGLTMSAVSQNASTRNVSAKMLFSGTDNIVKSVGNFRRIIIPVVNGEKLFDVSQVEKANDVEIDDEFTNGILKSIIMKMGVPPTSLDMLSQDEYVASQTQHRIDYRNLIIDRGVNYSKHITKAIKLIVNYSDLTIPSLTLGDKEDDNVQKQKVLQIDLSKINFNFVPPKTLTVNKITEEIGGINSLVDEIVKAYYGDDAREGKEWPVLISVTKKLLIKYFSSSTDWSAIDDIIELAKRETPGEYAKLAKYDIDVDPGDNEDGDNPPDDGMGGDMTGGDMGGSTDTGGEPGAANDDLGF